ncbi:MAG TPA: tRNA uracil 4-sulfurtransferase ThiI [Candidatus Binatia bacterium]|nr:tRNA uracil 4-sulfurtransferase ThiI [Candidatus Binatia bacterium]
MNPPAGRPMLVVHYHEISLKRGNRPLFLRHLRENVARALRDLPPVRLEQLTGRLVVDLAGHPDPTAVRDRVARVFGIANVALGVRTASTLDGLRLGVEHAIEGLTFRSFRITARRAFKTQPFTSVELNRDLGAHVLARHPARVDLERPEVNIFVEVMPGQAFVYADRRPGPGGLPVGTGGTVAALLSGGIDSPVAAWRMMKRGCRVVFVHFHSVPYLPDVSQRKARDLVAQLTAWQYASRLYLVPFGEIQREVVLAVPPPARVVVYRRLMIRIAEALARGAGAGALVTGESLGQVASQTLENLARIDEAAGMPVLRPLIGMDKIEITAQAKAIGTLETSTEPDADCCTLFVPRHPDTRVDREAVERLEARLDIAALVRSGADLAREERFGFPPDGPHGASPRGGGGARPGSGGAANPGPAEAPPPS